MRYLLLDTDLAMGAPGSDIDDGFALALAVAEPDLTVELVTTVNGNTDVDTATRLTRQLLARVDRPDIPVVRGSAAPLLTPRREASDGRPVAGAASSVGERSRHASVDIVERVMAQPGRFTIVAIGPLTNIAIALLLEPDVAAAVQEIVVMGGVFFGSTGSGSMPGEFNLWMDPHAAAIVLSSGAPLRFVGLDVTRQVRLTLADATAMAASGRRFASFAGECAAAWIEHQDRERPGSVEEHGSCALHDPLAVAVVAHPELVTWRPARVAVECASEVTRGVVVTDLLDASSPPTPNCEIASAVDVGAFTRLFLDRVSSL